MSQSRVAMLKARFKEEKEKKDGGGGGGNYTNNIYPFWTMDFGDVAKVRIIADSDPENEVGFYTEKFEHTLHLNGKDRKIPCLKMYGEECPICDLSRKYYDEDKKAGNVDANGRTVSPKGKYFYRNKTSIVRILVLDDPLPPNDVTGETFKGKVLTTQFGYQLMEKIKAEVMKGATDDVEDFTDLDNGYDFLIGKTKQGNGDSTYVFASGFDRRPTAVPKEYRELIVPMELKSKFPSKIPYETVEAMLTAYLTGEEYVEEGTDEKSDGKSEDKGTKTAAKPAVSSTPVKDKVADPVVEEAEEVEDDSDAVDTSNAEEPEDIMAAIQRRRNANK